MAQFVENLPDKCEDLSLEPQHSHKKSSVIVYACNPKTGKAKTKKIFPESCKIVTLAEFMSPSSLRDTVIKKKFKVIEKDTQSLVSKHAYDTYMYIHMLINTCKHIHNILKEL